MTSKFEQLIEYVINDEEQKAKELFHDIVVEKSREIYENLMNEEEVEEDAAEEEESIEEAEEEVEESIEEGMDQTSGSASQDLIGEVEADEEGMDEDEESDAEFDDEAETDGKDLTHDIEADGEGDIEDRVVDLEDKLDELMAEFEALMGDEAEEHGDDFGGDEPVDSEVGGDAYAQDDTSEFQDVPMSENISLAKVTPKMGDNGANTKSPVAANAGAAGMAASPVKMTGDTAQGRSAPKSGDLPGAGSFKNVPAKDGSKQAPAPKPVTAQAAGVNTTTPFPKG